MKRHEMRPENEQPDTGWSVLRSSRLAFLAAGLVAAAAIAPTPGFGDDRKADPPPMFNAGDETIGTLPVLTGPDVIELRRDLVVSRPSLCLEGELDVILNSIAYVRGDAVAQVMIADARSGRVRMVFPGNVQIGFDRLMIESSAIQIGLWTPDLSTEVQAQWSTRTMHMNTTNLGTKKHGAGAPFFELPVLGMSASGALSYAPLLLQAHGVSTSTSLRAASNADFLIVRQSP